MTFTQAVFQCKVLDTSLLEIRSPEEYSYLLNNTIGSNIWLGIKVTKNLSVIFSDVVIVMKSQSNFMGSWTYMSNNQSVRITDWYQESILH